VGSDQSLGSQVKTTGDVDPGVALRAAIEREFDAVRRGVEILVWRLGLAETRVEVIALGEDALQEVIRRALDRADAFDANRSVHAWLLGIATKVLQEQRRRIWRERQHLIGSIDSALESTSETNSSRVISGLIAKRVHELAEQQDQNVMEILDLVSPADREILTYRYVDQLDGREIAANLGISEGAARVRLSRALQKLTIEYHRSEDMLERDSER